MLIWLFVFIISMAALVIASDKFIESAEQAGIALGMPTFLVGVLIIGVGTSLPELVSSLFAIAKGSSEIVVGNVLGSNITNIFLVLGIAAILSKRLTITHDILNIDLPFIFGSALMLYLFMKDGQVTTGEAIFCLIVLVVYLFQSISGDNQDVPEKVKMTALGIITLVISPVVIFFGAQYTVESVIHIATIAKIPEEVIALSAVALGTSLPEVMVTISAAKRNNAEMAVGNVIGSNIFNSLAVIGIPGLISTLKVPQSIIDFSLPMFMGTTVLFILLTVDKRVNRGEGAFLVVLYGFFIGRLFHLI
ncbi:calcium/sodium antiporter [Spirochaeta cellobiosiphila]|uniref:calcium/sodium antiporter n=1 Tax=Spirochaeta cellobiosiphila TaxID=504483 RepID=UPI0004288899|nr:calcium/sodium antiporter [Spirochaeta cellobiosiphila]